MLAKASRVSFYLLRRTSSFSKNVTFLNYIIPYQVILQWTLFDILDSVRSIFIKASDPFGVTETRLSPCDFATLFF